MLVLTPQRLRVLVRAFGFGAMPVLLIGLVLIVAVLGDCLVRSTPSLNDEPRHFQRVLRARDGDFRPDSFQTNIPGYYVLVAGISRLTGLQSLQELRRISLFLSLSGVALFYIIRRKLEPTQAGLVAAQFLFLPFLLPYQFLVYVDPIALVLLLLSLVFALEDWPVLAGCAACASVLTRQPQIVWMLFVFVIFYVEKNGLTFTRQAVIDHLRRCWVFLIGFAAFAVFVLWNRGVALGDRMMHPAGSLHSENVFFALFLSGVAFFPLHLANMPRMLAAIRQHPGWITLGALLIFCAYWMSFRGDHPYNQPGSTVLLHNTLLNRLKASDLVRAAFFVPLAGVALSLVVTEMKRPAFYLVYPFAILFMAPSWMMETRYTIPFLALFILFRTFRSLKIEYANLGWSMATAAFLLVGTANQWFFL